MVDNSDALAWLRALTDQELRDVVRDVTADRPGLAALHAAAVGNVPPPVQIPAVPAAPVIAPTVQAPAPDYTDAGVPTLDRVRDKIDQRFGTSLGRRELDKDTPAGQSLQEKWDAREKAGRERLEEIRRSVHGTDDKPKGTE